MKILLTGDSIIARHEGLTQPMLNTMLEQKIPEIEINNTAISGINSGAFFAKMSKIILDQKTCDKLFILIGTNDLATHKQVPIDQFKMNLGLIASAVVSQYRPKNVFLISPPAVDEQKQHVRNNCLVEKYSNVLNEIAATYCFNYIDLCKAMLNHGNLHELCHGIKNDGLHFGSDGYELLSDLIKKALRK